MSEEVTMSEKLEPLALSLSKDEGTVLRQPA